MSGTEHLFNSKGLSGTVAVPQQSGMARLMAHFSRMRGIMNETRVMFWIRSLSVLRFMQFVLFATIGLDVTVRLPALFLIGCCSCALMYIIDSLKASNHRKSAAHQKVQEAETKDVGHLKKYSLSDLSSKYKQLMGFNLFLDGLALFNTNLLLIHLSPIVLVLMVFIAIVLYIASSAYVSDHYPKLSQFLKVLSAFLVITSCLGIPWFPSGLGLSTVIPWLSVGAHQLVFSACAAFVLTGFIGFFVWKYEKKFFQNFLARKAALETSVSDVIEPLKALGENFTLNHLTAQQLSGLGLPAQFIDLAKTVLKNKRPYHRLELEERELPWYQRNVFGLLILGAACLLLIGVLVVPGSVIQVVPWISVGVHRCVISVILSTFLVALAHFHFRPYEPKAAGRFFGALYFFLAIGSCIGMSLLPGKLGLEILFPGLNHFVTTHAFLVCFCVFSVVLSIIFAFLNKVYEEEDDQVLISHEAISAFEKLTLQDLIGREYLQYVSPPASLVSAAQSSKDKPESVLEVIRQEILKVKPDVPVSDIATITWKDLSDILISRNLDGSKDADIRASVRSDQLVGQQGLVPVPAGDRGNGCPSSVPVGQFSLQ